MTGEGMVPELAARPVEDGAHLVWAGSPEIAVVAWAAGSADVSLFRLAGWHVTPLWSSADRWPRHT